MHPSPTPGSSRRVFPIVLVFTVAACAVPAGVQPQPSPSMPPTPTAPPTTIPAVASTATPAPTDTPGPTVVPTTPPADLKISPATLSQLRPLWVLAEPGNPNAQSDCQDVACWMLSRIGSYAFGPDGATLGVGVCTVDSTENTTNPRHYRFQCDGPAEVRLYDSASGDLRQTLPVGDFPISLAFHPGGTVLAVGMAQRSVEIWDLTSGAKVQTLLHSTTRDGVVGLQFSPDGATLASYGDRLLQLWSWERGLPAGTIENVSDFAFSPSGETLATLFWSERGDYAEARFYPLDNLEGFRGFRLDWSKGPSRIVYIPDGSALVALGQGELELVDPQSGRILREARADALLRLGGLSGFTRTTSEITVDGRLLMTATVKEGDADYRSGLGLWDPRSDGATTWLLSYEEADRFQMGETFFPGFDGLGLTLAPGDTSVAASDSYSGAVWIWGIDPAASNEGLTCLGTCSS